MRKGEGRGFISRMSMKNKKCDRQKRIDERTISGPQNI